MVVRFFTHSQFHNKRPPTGSSQIRVHQLLRYWPEADLYKYGENPDVLIFQKIYAGQDYKFPVHFEKIKILDICDPDWMQGVAIKETMDAMHAITVPTKALKAFLAQMTDKPIVVIPDRFDLAKLPKKPKLHTGKAKTVAWFGYAHNADLLRPALPLLAELNLNLRLISNDDPHLHQFSNSIPIENYTFVKYDEKTIYTELRKADFAILPKGFRPEDKYKSENKTTKAILAGLPVASDKKEVHEFLEGENRRKHIAKTYNQTQDAYDVRKSVEQYKELISGIIKSCRWKGLD